MNLILALTERIDVNSDQRERAAVQPTVQTSVITRHEPHVGVQEREFLRLVGLRIGLRDHAAYVRKPDKTVEVGDRAQFGVDRIGGDRRRAEDVELTAEKW